METVQTKVAELKISTTDSSQFEPQLGLKNALVELGIDWKSPNFSYDRMIETLKELSENKDLHFWKRAEYEDLVTVLKIHKFWETEPLMFYTKKFKLGEIKSFKPDDVSSEPLPLPPGFVWTDFDIDNIEHVKEICEFL